MSKGKNFKKQADILSYRTPDRFRRLAIRKNLAMTARPRSLGGHR